MVIKASDVAMSATRDYQQTSSRQVATAVVKSDVAASLSLSLEGKKSAQMITGGSETDDYRDASGRTLSDIKKRLGLEKDPNAKDDNELQMRLSDAIMEAEAMQEKQKKAEDDAENRLWARRLGANNVTQSGNILGKQLKFIQSQDQFEAELIKKLMESLRKMMYGEDEDDTETKKTDFSSLGDGFAWDLSASNSFNASFGFGSISGDSAFGGNVSVSGTQSMRLSGNVGNAVAVPGWSQVTLQSNFVKETETTHFQTEGLALTADGRALNFNVDVEMSRAFEQQSFNFKEEAYRVMDPLVLNVDSDVASVSDYKFYFDLDADGKEELISFADKGSAFLALDKNGDGKINDGSELFGTRSGDGFKDLAAYDEDGNGWIDEADDIFKHLTLWTKDENGNDRMVSLKDADVGAIYLGNASTQFSLMSDAGDKNALIRSTGVYLKESGGAGTIQHVDLVL